MIIPGYPKSNWQTADGKPETVADASVFDFGNYGNLMGVFVNYGVIKDAFRNNDTLRGSLTTILNQLNEAAGGVWDLTLSLNGEVECLKSDFEKINQKQEENGEDPYKNPRNYTAGRMGKEDAEEIKDSKLSIAFYSITGFDNWQNYYKNEIERAKWANKELGLGGFFVQVRPHRFEDLQKMEDFAKELDYEVDGIILKVSDLEDQEQLGNHGDDPIKEPRGAIAWKFTEETAIAEVKEIEWNASRTRAWSNT
jgi:DNA ligase (NAD+)